MRILISQDAYKIYGIDSIEYILCGIYRAELFINFGDNDALFRIGKSKDYKYAIKRIDKQHVNGNGY